MSGLDVSSGTKQRRFWDWKWLILGLVTLILLYQVLVPLFFLVFGSFKTVPPGHPDYLSLKLSLANYARAYGSAGFWQATQNSFIFAACVSTLAFIVGSFLAWITERSNTPLRKLIFLLAVVRVIMPGILITISWVLLLSPEIGILNQIFQRLFDLASPPFNIYSLAGMIWVETVEVIPLAFLLMAGTFRSMDPNLEEASLTCRTGVFATFRRVTLPLALPSILSVYILLFLRVIDAFEVPAIIGMPAGIHVYSTKIYLTATSAPADHGLAGAYAMTLLLLSAFLVSLYIRLTGEGARFVTITGKAYRPRAFDLGSWKYATCVSSLLLVFGTFGLAFFVIVWSSLLPFYQSPSWESFALVGLRNYHELWNYPFALNALKNSAILGLGSATVVMLLAALVSYIVVKTRLRGRALLDILAFSPIAIPGMTLALAVMWVYLVIPIPVYGTLWIIFLAYVTKYMDVSTRIMSASFKQLSNELEEASLVCRASWRRTFFVVLLPLLKPGFMAGWIWIIIHAFRELSIAMMLYYSGTEPISVAIFDLWEGGSYGVLAALGVVVFAIMSFLVTISKKISERFGVREA
ncbi:MAG: hypothetical protein A3F90_02550 [Deltaproteobacteria bacterium RIFCSPLOWO2_12_FULL_60_19]|nr:MAG: hypothetical protein A3F90_02550 [Deltaproteobacteria bacterium RIFCSPLOWO2_12_FULL_60_19]